MDRAQRPRRLDLLRLCVGLLLLLCVLLQLAFEVGLLDRRGERALEFLAQRLVRCCDRLNLVRVTLVLALLALALARTDPEDESDNDHDRDRDEADKPCEGDEPGWRSHRRPGRTAAAAAYAGPLQPRQAPPPGRLEGLGLVEEVELDVLVVVGAHSRSPRSGRGSGQTVSRGTAKEETPLRPPTSPDPCPMLRSRSKAPGSSSTDTARCVPWGAADRGRSGSPATSRRGSMSLSRSSPGRARPPRGPSARLRRPLPSAPRAACAPTPSHATRVTSTSRTSSSRARRSARRCVPA